MIPFLTACRFSTQMSPPSRSLLRQLSIKHHPPHLCSFTLLYFSLLFNATTSYAVVRWFICHHSKREASESKVCAEHCVCHAGNCAHHAAGAQEGAEDWKHGWFHFSPSGMLGTHQVLCFRTPVRPVGLGKVFISESMLPITNEWNQILKLFFSFM